MILREQQMSEVRCLPFLKGEVAVFSVPAPSRQTPNEDGIGLFSCGEDSGVLAVCDGAGGIPGGVVAARITLEHLDRKIAAAGREGDLLRAGILNGLEAANRALRGMSPSPATTGAVVEIQGDTIRPYHVGDSVILLVGQRGRIKLETVAHSPVGFAVESGYLDPDQAMHHEDRHLVSNLIGMSDMRIEMGCRLQMAPRDTLLLASDGVYDNLHMEEIIEIIRRGPLYKAASLLAGHSHGRMIGASPEHPSKPDDLSFIMYRRGG